MTWVVPRWALLVLAGAAAGSCIAGLALEQTTWATDHPFSLNLLSSLAGFGASLAFASLVLNRMARRQYWSAELDRRVRAASAIDNARRELADFFGLGQRRPVLGQLQEERQRLAEESAGGGRPVTRTTRPGAYPALARSVSVVVDLEHRLAFVADGELIYRCDRLNRKWEAFSGRLSTDTGVARAALAEEAVVSLAIELAEALESLGRWVLDAPDRKMKAAVSALAFRSDLS